MKTILLSTDFSATARNAAFYAADMAQAINADLHLLHVYSLPVSYGEVTFAFDPEDFRKDSESELLELKNELCQLSHISVGITTEVRQGNYLQQLQQVCDKMSPYAVVVGATGKSGAERLLLGSNAIQTMKSLAWPVITVPDGMHFTAIQRIGLACDLKELHETIPVYEIEHLVQEFNAELHVLNIARTNKYDPAIMEESGYLKRLLSKVKPKFHFLRDVHTDQGILDFAVNNSIDLLIILPKRHSLFDAIMHKSHTKQFVLHSNIPVIALHKNKQNV